MILFLFIRVVKYLNNQIKSMPSGVWDKISLLNQTDYDRLCGSRSTAYGPSLTLRELSSTESTPQSTLEKPQLTARKLWSTL